MEVAYFCSSRGERDDIRGRWCQYMPFCFVPQEGPGGGHRVEKAEGL